MDKAIMAFTMLKKYRDLDPLITTLDNQITTQAVNSHFYDASFGVDKLANNIIDMIESKRILYNLKTIVKQSVRKLNKLDQKVFDLFFIQKQKTPTIADTLKINKMQAYRMVQAMPKKLLPHLEKTTYFQEFCKEDYCKINYIKLAYEHYSETEEKLII